MTYKIISILMILYAESGLSREEGGEWVGRLSDLMFNFKLKSVQGKNVGPFDKVHVKGA